MGIYKQKDRHGRQWYVVSVYWPRNSGRSRYFVPKKAMADKLQARILMAKCDGTWPELRRELSGLPTEEATLAQFAEKFIEQYAKPRMRTWYDYERSINNVCKLFGSLHLSEFDRSHMHRYVEMRSKQVSGASVNREIAAVSKMFSYAVYDLQLIKHHPLVRFRKLPEQKKSFKPLTLGEVWTLINCVEDQVVRALVGVIAETALRKEEGLELRWENVDLHKRTISLDKTKNYKVRQVPLSDTAVQHLGSLPRFINNPYVFVNASTGKRWVSPEKQFRAACKKARLEGIGFHDLRRFRATQWHDNGVEVRVIQELLGHSSLETTRRYLGISKDAVKAVRHAQERDTASGSEPAGSKQAVKGER